ncbi:MAG: diguanylate cyclase [Spirochaeta sp.]|jgi:diguanylate cyclase (GGDEF)-like protein/PAS domain S-box-containing protein|nr:diguanylate cyclase [Spirochaeta sp.]
MIDTLLQDTALRHRLFESGFFFGDLEHDFGYTSKTLTQLGFGDQEMRSGEYQKRIHPDDVPTYEALWQRVNEGWANDFYVEYRVADTDGAYHWVETHAVVISRKTDDSIGEVIGTDRDISARKEAELVLERKVRESLRNLEVTDEILKSSTLATETAMLSRNLQKAIGQISRIVQFERCDIYACDRLGETTLVLSVPEFGSPDETAPEPFDAEVAVSSYPVIRNNLPGTGPFRSALGIPLVTDETHIGSVYLWHRAPGFYGGTDLYPVMTVGTIFAVALHNHHAFRQTVSELETDELTGFLTRRSFYRTANELWEDRRARGSSHTVAMIDLDHFKSINDSYGHGTGDSVLRSVAHLISTALRSMDILGRYGGEEFVVVLPTTDTVSATLTMERIRHSCEVLNLPEFAGSVTVSIGIATTSDAGDPEPLSAVIERADQALYRAKRNGRNRVEVTPD